MSFVFLQAYLPIEWSLKPADIVVKLSTLCLNIWHLKPCFFHLEQLGVLVLKLFRVCLKLADTAVIVLVSLKLGSAVDTSVCSAVHSSIVWGDVSFMWIGEVVQLYLCPCSHIKVNFVWGLYTGKALWVNQVILRQLKMGVRQMTVTAYWLCPVLCIITDYWNLPCTSFSALCNCRGLPMLFFIHLYLSIC